MTVLKHTRRLLRCDERTARRDLPEPVGMEAHMKVSGPESQSRTWERAYSWPGYHEENLGWPSKMEGGGRPS